MNIVLNIEEAQLRGVLEVLGRTGDTVNIVINIKEEKPRDVRTKNMLPHAKYIICLNSQDS